MFLKKIFLIHKKSTASEEKYLSLSEAAKYTPYSAEYLSLRARQGKLKAIKIGKIWVTKREWVKEYVRKYRGVEEVETKPKIKIQKPKIKFQIPKIKTEILFALTILLFFVSVALAKDSLKILAKEIVSSLEEVGEDFIIGANSQIKKLNSSLSKIRENIQSIFSLAKEGAKIATENFGESLSQTSKEITFAFKKGKESVGNFFAQIFQKTVFGVAAIGETAQRGFLSVSEIFKEYFQWLGENFLAVGGKIKNFGLNVKENIAEGIRGINEGIKGMGEKISKVPEIFKKKAEEVRIQVGVPEEITKKITSLEEKIKELEERPPQVKEVEVERKIVVQPIREVEKITEFIPSEELAKIKSQLAIFGEITKKIQPTPPYTTAPTSPIFVPQGITGGTGIFASLSAESAAFRTLGVGASATLGSAPQDKLTINASSFFTAPIVVGQNALIIDTSGNLTTIGDITVSGDLTIGGATNFSGPFTLISTSTPQLTVKYDNSNKLEVSVSSDGTSTIFTTGNFVFNPGTGQIITSGNFVDVGGATVRAVGERVFRGAVSIYRYGIPAETGSTNWVRISKEFESGNSHPLVSTPEILPGSERVYRLAISYSDDIPTNSSSTWKIAKVSDDSTIATFNVPGVGASSLEEPRPYLTQELPIPNDDWKIELKVPSGNKIRIFNIFLLAFDKVNQ